MLIEFRCANFRSIDDAQVFSMVASKDAKHPDNLIPCDGFSLLKSAGIYGANASGKSNLLKAMQVMGRLVSESATRMNDGDAIEGIVPFKLNTRSRSKPSLFEVTILLNSTRFRYGFTATRQRVHDEWLIAYSSEGQEQTWFERRLNTETKETTWNFSGPLEEEGKLLQARTRDNALALSTGPLFNMEPLKNIFHWFQIHLEIYDLSRHIGVLKFIMAMICVRSEDWHNRIESFVQDADMDINKVIVRHSSHLASALDSGVDKMYETQIEHRMTDSEDNVRFDIEEESNGTQRLVAVAGMFLNAIDEQNVLVLDELDCSMHPLLTRKLIELFQSQSANKKGAQLIFVTHDSTLLDPELFRRDQIWLVEKNHNKASEYFSLYDFDVKDRPRNTEAFQRNYLAGRYGGVPQFGPTFEDLEIK